ncbi:hypothetical protein SAMN02745181_2833 [Rubritalea squalenifaciens DSM 18772]|uniref:Uncharacterized protein n=1 Tax=Rubritalea squalenifaciens DSM 18772 TaxID=1123071 RepID=A0A1M6NEQ3_9BACT|nr:hypothetical protein [Rubritalea squalenifaciens]SHJ94133.1 hypothetical protein SAMN02745181_2833 [Rubritalea squalenifaciens DSM 18772]
MENSSNNLSIETLLEQVQNEPNNWSARKKASLKLYEQGRYLEAADVLWKAPEMPATDVDVAFSIKVVSRARPNRSIRLVYELIRRNAGKPMKNLAMARALNMIGMPMLASRFYGAAVAEDGQLFDLSFEKQTLWYDDSGSLLDQWKETDQEAKPPLAVPLQEFTGEYIEFDKLLAHHAETKKTASVGSTPTTPLSMPKPLPQSSEKPVNPATNPNPNQPAEAGTASTLSKPAPFVAPPVQPKPENGAPVIPPRPQQSAVAPPAAGNTPTTPLIRPNVPASQIKRPTLLRADVKKEQGQ